MPVTSDQNRKTAKWFGDIIYKWFGDIIYKWFGDVIKVLKGIVL